MMARFTTQPVLLCAVSVVPVGAPLDELTGDGVDGELIFGASVAQLALVDGASVVELKLEIGKVAAGDAGFLTDELFGSGLADVVAADGGGGQLFPALTAHGPV